MPRSTTTRRRVSLILLIAVALLGYWFWQSGSVRLGLTAPGGCTWSDDSGVGRRLSVSDSIDEWQRLRAAGLSIAKESVTCSLLPAAAGAPELSPRGLTANGERLFAAVEKEFGRLSYGGFEPGGATSGHIEGSDHYSGRAIDYFFRPHTSKKQRLAGWQLAQWAVINAERLDITLVIFDERIWTRGSSILGWRPYTHPEGPTDNVIKRHLDHVHISVS